MRGESRASVLLENGSFPGLSESSIAAIREIEEEILNADALLKEDSSASETKNPPEATNVSRPRIPIEINENVLKWIHYFTVTDRERFHRFLKRGNEYKPLVQDILRKHRVPTELYYLAMIESGYVTHARSRARAVGAWQFIQGTGKRYGLQQTRYLDERRDMIRSTEAAARYLKDLHTAFQSWYLAMAGYNAGEGRILRAIMKGNSRDFWHLVEKKALPPETRNYVPKFMAAAIIGHNPEKYGFNDIEAEPFPEHEPAEVPGGVRLQEIARQTGVPLATLKRMNPHLIRAITPADRSSYSIWVPAGKKDEVEGAKAALARTRIRASRTYASAASSKHTHGKKVVFHRVRRGEALTLISRRYGVPISRIKKLNSLRSNRIYAGQKLVIKRGI